MQTTMQTKNNANKAMTQKNHCCKQHNDANKTEIQTMMPTKQWYNQNKDAHNNTNNNVNNNANNDANNDANNHRNNHANNNASKTVMQTMIKSEQWCTQQDK